MIEEDELTYGETIKQPFPKFDAVEKFNVPQWLRLIITDAKPSHLSSKWDYKAFKLAYENGVDITWQLKQTDPHAEIKAEYEKAIAEGKIVKVFCLSDGGVTWFEENRFQFNDGEYQLRFYNIDWNKLLSWSYANGEFIECEFSSNDLFMTDLTNSYLKAILTIGFLEEDGVGMATHKHCRLAKGVEIKDEWLKEIK